MLRDAAWEWFQKIFHQKYQKSEGCWLWTAAKNRQGYGIFGIGKKTYLAHRVSFEIHHRLDPGNFLVCHRCHNPSCVNPDHLYLGTHQDNFEDSREVILAARSQVPMQGENHPGAKLTWNDVAQIRELLAMGVKQVDIARKFNVTPTNIGAIKKGKSWRQS